MIEGDCDTCNSDSDELTKARDVALRWALRVKLVDARAELARMALEGKFDAILPASELMTLLEKLNSKLFASDQSLGLCRAKLLEARGEIRTLRESARERTEQTEGKT